MAVGVSNNRGFPPKWMVKIMENLIEMDDLRVPLFLETPMCAIVFFSTGPIHQPKSGGRGWKGAP